MLKAILSVDCDNCHEPLDTAMVCCDLEHSVWAVHAKELIDYAVSQGWDFHSASQRLVCFQCLEHDTGMPLRMSPAETSLALHALRQYMQVKGCDLSANTVNLKEKLARYLGID